ncbi:29095_t:CDS:2, partial [Racocetra persica]
DNNNLEQDDVDNIEHEDYIDSISNNYSNSVLNNYIHSTFNGGVISDKYNGPTFDNYIGSAPNSDSEANENYIIQNSKSIKLNIKINSIKQTVNRISSRTRQKINDPISESGISSPDSDSE